MIILFDYCDFFFGEVYGVVMKEFCLLVCFVFVVNVVGEIVYMEVVLEGSDYLNYEVVIEVVKKV